MSAQKWVVVDVESDGPLQGDNSMVCFGAVILKPELDLTFYGRTRPIRPDAPYDPGALAISGFNRGQHLLFEDPAETMRQFKDWLDLTADASKQKVVLVSDNPAYDFPWINWYFHRFIGHNPFGWSGRRIGDIYAGLKRDAQAPWKQLRKTGHDHNPVNDAKGNAEALLEMVKMGFRIPGVKPVEVK